jgi:polysaccharide export outer membrane protein
MTVRQGRPVTVAVLLMWSTMTFGCATTPALRLMQLEESAIPRELDKGLLPAYVVEPPDILLIQAVSTLRTADSPLHPGDRLQIRLKNGLPINVETDPEANPLQFNAELEIELGFKLLAGTYLVGGDGAVNLGPAYGRVHVAGRTVVEAEAVIMEHLKRELQLLAPELQVTLEDVELPQPVGGEHLVRPDGRVSLGIYGDVFVAGMTLPEVEQAVRKQMIAAGVESPRVAVDVVAYNSKLIYVITDGGGFGEQVVRLPYTGNDTVLDAIAQIQGLSQVSSKRIWVARPVPANTGAAQILEVEWEDIAALGQTATNYQLLPGDRIYIKADKWIATDNLVSKIIAPAERILGFTSLGAGTVRTLNQMNQNTGNGNIGF